MVERSVCNFKTRGDRLVIREEDREERCEWNDRRERMLKG